MGELDGQVAIVTGGGRGIGRAIAEALTAAGAAVAVVARSVDQLTHTVTAIERDGGRTIAVTADVSDRVAVDQLVAETEQQLGPVDLLVNNAGIGGPAAPLWEADPEAWHRCLDVNLYGPFLCARAVLPGMVERRRGRIINVSSSVSYPAPYYTAYMSAKVALTRLTESLAMETREFGIAIFSISPGGVNTGMAEETRASSWNSKMEAMLGINGEQRWTTPVELSGTLCVALASGVADALSGRHFDVRQDVAALAAEADAVLNEDRFALRIRPNRWVWLPPASS
jgi:NAD(P)-dependent dehydrogenase (short-subunit alcohol dehydrogenase family)